MRLLPIVKGTLQKFKPKGKSEDPATTPAEGYSKLDKLKFLSSIINIV